VKNPNPKPKTKMKNLISLLSLVVLSFIASGCASTKRCDSLIGTPAYAECIEDVRQENLVTWSGRLQALCDYGTVRAHKQLNPEGKAKLKEVVTKAIAGLDSISGPDLSMDQLIEVMRWAGLTELSDGEVQMYIADGRFLFSMIGVELKITKPEEVELFRLAMRNGLSSGLASIS
jgi:hypothetical protein